MNVFKFFFGFLFLIGGVLLIIVGVLQLLALIAVGPQISTATALVIGMALFIFIIPGVLLFWLSRKLRSNKTQGS